MRTLAMTCSLALCCSGSLCAQGLELGVKGGVNVASQRLTGDDAGGNLSSRAGPVAGVFATIPIASWFAVQPEALYAVKGGRLEVGGVTASIVIDYLEVPVLARVTRGGAGRVGYYAAAGPSIGFRVRARSRTTFSGSTEELDLGNQVERLDVGVAVGGGVEKGALVFDGRYTLGLTDIDRDTSASLKTTNRTLSLTVGYRF